MRAAALAGAGRFRLGRSGSPVSVLALGIGAVVALGPLMLTSERWMRVFVLVLIYAVLASGLNLLVGHAGLLDLGYIAFFAIGAYYTSILSVDVAINGLGLAPESIWWLFFINLAVAGVITAGAGVILGYPTLRARGDYLAIMTLAFGEVVRLLAINLDSLTGGPIGIRGVPPLQVFGVQLHEPLYLYYAALVIAAGCLFFIVRLTRSFVGRAWNAIREDELAAGSMGVPTHRYKLLAYASGAFFAGVIGVFFAHLQQFINPDSFTLEDNLVVLALVILGGAGTLWGPPLGAAVWIIFQEWVGEVSLVQDYPELRMVALALLILIVIRYLPRGVVRTRPSFGFTPVTGPAKGSQPWTVADAPRDAEEKSPEGDSATDAGEAIAVPRGRGAHNGEASIPALRVEGVVCRFGGVTALEDVNLRVDPGEILGVIGPNGAGKSTLFNVITGVVKPDAGRVFVREREVRGAKPSQVAALGVGRTFQTVRLMSEMTVLENVLVGAHNMARVTPVAVALRTPLARAREQTATAAAQAALRTVGLPPERWDVRAGTLPYVDQRRIEIARALVSRPALLLLDEPAAGLNPSETKELAELIDRIRAEGLAIVLIEHDMGMVMSVCDRLMVLDHGEKIADGDPEEVRADERVVTAYLGGPA